MTETKKPSTVTVEWAQPAEGAIARIDGVGNQELEVMADVGVAAVQAKAEAMVKARFTLAQWRPRDIEVVRQRLLKDCKRPGFAEKARYRIPRGDGMVEGFTIRFAENCLRQMGNLSVTGSIIAEDAKKRVVLLSCTDLETNATDEQEVLISKTIERKGKWEKGVLKPPDGRDVLGQRTNSYGEPVFIVSCTDDEMLIKTNAAVSRMRRNKILEMVPYDVLEECRVAVATTKAAADKAVDPDTKKRQMIDAFGTIGVPAAQLVLWLEHPLESCTPDEVDELRELYNAVKEGEVTWAQVLGRKDGDEEPKAPVAPKKPAATAAAATKAETKPVESTPTTPPAGGSQVANPPPVATAPPPPVATAPSDDDEVAAGVERAIKAQEAGLPKSVQMVRALTSKTRAAADEAGLKAKTAGEKYALIDGVHIVEGSGIYKQWCTEPKADVPLVIGLANPNTPAPVQVIAFPAEPAEGTTEHAEWLIKVFDKCEDLAALKKLTRKMGKIHEARAALVNAHYSHRKQQLEGGAK